MKQKTERRFVLKKNAEITKSSAGRTVIYLSLEMDVPDDVLVQYIERN